MRLYYLAVPAIMFAIHAPGAALASEMVYHPVIPAFGGNPLNGQTLLSIAQAQGEGTKSGSQGPDLSGLNDALKNIGNGPAIIIGGGTGNGGTGGTGGTGGNGTNMPAPAVARGMVP
jgi:curli production assembly/transport component CsgF